MNFWEGMRLDWGGGWGGSRNFAESLRDRVGSCLRRNDGRGAQE